MLLGLASVACSAHGNFELAAWMILWGALLDKADGSAARLLKASSRFGAEFDSFADFIAFGIAPAALYFFRVEAAFSGVGRSILLATTGLYVLAVAVRLARFNISTPPHGDQFFYGFPTTLMGAILGAFYLTREAYGTAVGLGLLEFTPLILFMAGLCMVSTIRIPKLKHRKSLFANIFQYGNVTVAYILAPMMLLPEVLFVMPLIYIAWGVTHCLLNPLPDEEETEDDIIHA